MHRRAFDPLISFADDEGWSQAELLAGLSISETDVRESRGHIPWDQFARYLEAFEAKIGGPDEMRRIEGVLAPSYGSLASFLGLMASPRSLMRWLNRLAGPSNFPAVTQTTQEIDARTTSVELRIPDDLRDSPTFFRITEQMFRVLPTLVGARPAVVDLTIRPRHAHFVVHLPPSSTIFARIARAFQAFLSGERVLDELVEQQDRLLENHAVLQRTYKTLQESEKNFRDLIERMPDGVLVLDGEATAYANPAMHEFLGVPPGALNEGRISEFVVSGPLVAQVLGLLAGDEDARNEIEFRRRDGSIVVGSIVPLEATWNGEAATVLVVQDVTERNRIMDRALQLDRVIAVGTMAAGVAHEINNPMAFIHSNLEYSREMLDEVKGHEDLVLAQRIQKVIEALNEALEGSSRVRDIVWDLKSFSRAPEESRVPVDLVEAVRAAINMSWHEVRHRAKVRTEYQDVPPVLANAGRLSQVVLNLVVNAAQAMPDRDRELNLVTIRTMEEPERGIVEVEDNGRGIEPEHLRRIFDPFYTTKAVGEGTGLGLWICRDIVTRAGGSITVDTAVGRGSIFRIELPYAREVDAEAPHGVGVETRAPAAPAPAPPEEPATIRIPMPREAGRLRVLMVDDEPKILKMVARVLKHCDVITFSDPHLAMQALHRDDDFDVVLCDATMPGLNGRDFFRRLQAEYPPLAQRFVLVTGGLTKNWERTEFPCIVTKPFNLEELRSIVELVGTSVELGETPSIH